MNSPNSFIIIVDNEGDSVELMSDESIVSEIVQVLQNKDKQFPMHAPHSAWKWKKELDSAWGRFNKIQGQTS